MIFNFEKQATIKCKKLYNNIALIRKEIPEKTKFIAVIKGSAYGHGLKPMAHALSTNDNIDMLAVSSLQEAISISDCKKPILVLYSVLADNIRLICEEYGNKSFVEDKLIFTLTSMKEIEDYIAVAKSCNIKLSVQLRLDFNGGVRGFLEDDYLLALEKIIENKDLNLFGLCTHTYEAYSDNDMTTKETLDRYAGCFDSLPDDLRKKLVISMLTSFSFPKFKDYAYDAVRIGTAMYGLPVEACQMDGKDREFGVTTEPIMDISASLIKIIESDDNVSIDYTGNFNRKSKRIGLVAIGNWDIPYFFKGQSCKVIVNDKLTEIIGKPCMDSCCVDLSQVPDAKPGDLVYFLANKPGITLIEKLIENNIRMCDSQDLFIGMDRLPKIYN